MVNLPLTPSAICGCNPTPRFPKLQVLQLFLSEVPTHLNSEGEEKLRGREWLISAILLEINQLAELGGVEGEGN